jgi:1,4-alpha-glucan branching enzyme
MNNLHTTNYGHADSAVNSQKTVSFFCAAPNARRVDLEGDFNNWMPSPMIRSVDGWWIAQVELCRGHHLYRFLLDGRPILDLSAHGTGCNEEGERVSLIEVS